MDEAAAKIEAERVEEQIAEVWKLLPSYQNNAIGVYRTLYVKGASPYSQQERLQRSQSELRRCRGLLAAHLLRIKNGISPSEYVRQYYRWLAGEGPLPNIRNVVLK